MRIAVIGSRNLDVKNLGEYLPCECDEIVSGGAKGVDTSAANFARESGIRLTEFFPQYEGLSEKFKDAEIIVSEVSEDPARYWAK